MCLKKLNETFTELTSLHCKLCSSTTVDEVIKMENKNEIKWQTKTNRLKCRAFGQLPTRQESMETRWIATVGKLVSKQAN